MKDSGEFNKLWMGWNEINLIGQEKKDHMFRTWYVDVQNTKLPHGNTGLRCRQQPI